MKALITVVLALSGAVLAVAAPQSDPIMLTAELPTRPPPVQQSGPVRWLNGGAGAEEVAWMRSQAPHYPLQVVISERDGEYRVADRFVVRRGQQTLAEVAQAGPWLLFDLPPGRYRLEASFGGRVQVHDVQLDGRGSQRVGLVAPVSGS